MFQGRLFLAQFTVRTQHFDFSLSKFEMQDRNGWNIALGAMWSPRANFETRNGGLGRGSRVRCFPTNGRISSLHHALLLLLRIAFRIWVCTHPKRFPGFARKIFLFLRKILSTQISKNIFFQQEPPILYFEKTKHLLLAFTWSQSRSPAAPTAPRLIMLAFRAPQNWPFFSTTASASVTFFLPQSTAKVDTYTMDLLERARETVVCVRALKKVAAGPKLEVINLRPGVWKRWGREGEKEKNTCGSGENKNRWKLNSYQKINLKITVKSKVLKKQIEIDEHENHSMTAASSRSVTMGLKIETSSPLPSCSLEATLLLFVAGSYFWRKWRRRRRRGDGGRWKRVKKWLGDKWGM